MIKKKELEATVGTLAPKSTFTYGGVNWLVLQNTANGILCLAEKILFNKAFDKEDSNYWADSSLREHLNNDFLEEIIKAGASETDFIPMELDLTADDGLDDYGTSTDLIGLIDCQQYRKFRKLIPNADGWWWTVTPYSTKNNGYSCNVRYVYSDGALDGSGAYYGYGGVRPLCTLQSSILVSINHAENSQTAEEETNTEDTEEAAESEDTITELHKEAMTKFYECVSTAQDRYINGDEDLVSVCKAMETLNNNYHFGRVIINA